MDKWINKLNISYNNVAYIGDDIPDLPILEKIGFSSCPKDATHDTQNIVDYICNNNGGDGAVREFCELLINKFM